MKLILTSNGLSTPKLRNELLSFLEQKISETKIMVLHTARKPEHLFYINEAGKELVKAGALHPNICYSNISLNISTPNLSEYNLVYICGGNTFYILDRMRKIGLDVAIKNFVKAGRVYLGVSAGSIIAGQSIEIAGWGTERDINEINLKNLKGLHFTNIALFPHYKISLKKELEEFKLKVNYPVEPLYDGEAIFIDNKGLRKIK